jgi:hypothetical protein
MARIRMLATTALLGAALLLGASGPAPAQDADTPLDKALQRVETLISSEKAKPNPDEKLLKSLEAIADDLRKEKDSRGGGKGNGGGGAGPAAGGGGGGNWALEQTKTAFTKGVDLKEDEKASADQIITEFVTDYGLARTAEDDKSKPVIRDHTEKRIGRTFSPRDANRLKDNLDEIIKYWDRGWRGRGR